MPSLLVTHGHHFGVRFALIDRTTVGRSSGCSIQLLDEKVSRLHSTIAREGDRYVLRDEGSSNGTGLNGRLLLEPTPLRPGDELAIGNNLMLFAPELEILRDLEGAGVVILAPPPEGGTPGGGAAQLASAPLRLEALLGSISDLLTSPRGVGRPTALVEAVARGLGADRAALLVAPTGGEPMKAVAVWPHRGRVTVARPQVLRVLEERRAVAREGVLELTVRQGRSLIEVGPGASFALPLILGGRVRGVFYADSSTAGAFQNLTLDQVGAALNIAFAPLLSGDPALLRPVPTPSPPDDPISLSSSMTHLLERVRGVAERPTPVLLHGEPGTGKRYIARLIHRSSPRSQGPFVALHCGAYARDVAEAIVFGHEADAIPGVVGARPGLVELADGGTLFLDDLGELGAPLQVKLLRMLQEGRVYRVGGTRPMRVDARVISGTWQDLDQLVGGGLFRSDLRDELAADRLDVPPLRERLADLAGLVERFVQDFCGEHGALTQGFSPEALGLLEAHPWPGNVRELRDAVQRLLVRARGEFVEGSDVRVELAVLPSAGQTERPAELSARARQLEAELVSRALGRARGSRTRAARLLGITQLELDRRVLAWDLDLYGS